MIKIEASAGCGCCNAHLIIKCGQENCRYYNPIKNECKSSYSGDYKLSFDFENKCFKCDNFESLNNKETDNYEF